MIFAHHYHDRFFAASWRVIFILAASWRVIFILAFSLLVVSSLTYSQTTTTAAANNKTQPAAESWFDIRSTLVDTAKETVIADDKKRLSPKGELPDITEYNNHLTNITLADNRRLRPGTIQITVDDWLFWGLGTGYHLNSYIFLGANINSLDFVRIFVPQDKEISFSANIAALNHGAAARLKFDTDSNFQYYHLFLRFFPFENSGFFGQMGYIYHSWQIASDIFIKDAAGFSNVPPSSKVGRVVIDPKSAVMDVRLGWSWVSRFGFSHALGLKGATNDNPDFQIISEKSPAGDDLLAANEVKVIKSAIENRLLIFKHKWRLFFSFGYNF